MSIVTTNINMFAELERVKKSTITVYELDDKQKCIKPIYQPDCYGEDAIPRFELDCYIRHKPDGFIYVIPKHHLKTNDGVTINGITIIKIYVVRDATPLQLYEHVLPYREYRSDMADLYLLCLDPAFDGYKYPTIEEFNEIRKNKNHI